MLKERKKEKKKNQCQFRVFTAAFLYVVYFLKFKKNVKKATHNRVPISPLNIKITIVQPMYRVAL
jgi:hypothetical protein